MNSFWMAVAITFLVYGAAQAWRTFVRELKALHTGALAGLCAILISLYLLGVYA